MYKCPLRSIPGVALAVLALNAAAAELRGPVVSIADGDTLNVLVEQRRVA
jgi:hypothetical protein